MSRQTRWLSRYSVWVCEPFVWVSGCLDCVSGWQHCPFCHLNSLTIRLAYLIVGIKTSLQKFCLASAAAGNTPEANATWDQTRCFFSFVSFSFLFNNHIFLFKNMSFCEYPMLVNLFNHRTIPIRAPNVTDLRLYIIIVKKTIKYSLYFYFYLFSNWRGARC